eukprot:7769861-Ditylum_brightwellii.AAC.1
MPWCPWLGVDASCNTQPWNFISNQMHLVGSLPPSLEVLHTPSSEILKQRHFHHPDHDKPMMQHDKE